MSERTRDVERWDGDVRVLEAQVEAGILEITRRLERQDVLLKEIHGEVRRTNGRVTRLETIHESGAHPIVTGELDRQFNRRDLTIFLAGGGALIAGWKFIEWAFHLLQASRP